MRRIKFVCLLICASIVLAIPALAQSADDLYNRAVNKYFLGDENAAITLLNQALEIDPNHNRSIALMTEIRKELGLSKPLTTTTVKPQTKPVRRVTARRATSTTLKPFTGMLLPTPPSADFADMQGTINQIVLLLLAVILLAVLVAIRGTYFIVRDAVARNRMQICPDCKTRNPEQSEFCAVCGTRLKAWSGITSGQKKWFSKFNWKRNPFTLDVIPGLFTGYSAQVNSIMEKINTRSGHILVYGEKGVGKTTLLRWLTSNLKNDNHSIYIARPPLVFDDMLRLVVSELKPGFLARRKKYSLYDIEGLVKKTKKPVVLMLDEAHEFTAEIEQQMRSLGDIQGVNYVLGGLPETRDKIKKDSPPFFDRIVLEAYIDHLNREETKDLIKKRIEDAGGKGIAPFTEEAIDNVFKMSKGRPRMILKVCDWVVTDAIRNNMDKIGGQVGQDFPKDAAEAEKAYEHEAEGQK